MFMLFELILDKSGNISGNLKVSANQLVFLN